ncbi:transferrin receptor 1b isoform X2 [Oryzias melastigma]|uniref:transferrin receptor 1b isoform X2 n=1 Tax=Oryzias melastigma TaxID=30732 RepID=UPI00168D621D|nr:transferrin receptor 1b isoform X2 [Oryzias melastigma]
MCQSQGPGAGSGPPAAMDRVRSAFNGVMRSERYSRFTLQPSENGERHAEVKLSEDDVVEEHDSPSFRLAPPQQNRRSLIFLVLAAMLLLLFGFIVGYATSSKHQAEPPVCNQTTQSSETARTPAPTKVQPADVPPQLSWKDLTKALADQLTKETLQKTLGTLDLKSRSAGSVEDISLGNRIFEQFAALQMNPWTDVHYVQLQKPDRTRPNQVLFGSEVFKPRGFLAYSATGRAQGRLVYANYGRQTDLDLVEKIVELNGSVLLIRAGNFSFAEQVENAASRGASAVLIYPDVEDFNLNDDVELYGHVHLGSGDPYTPGFPSFNHTQFSPTRSSGLPKILAQTIPAKTAKSLFKQIGGPVASAGFKGKFTSVTYSLGGVQNITVEVNNQLVNTEIHNIFGVIKGFSDPDRFVVLGAQRDAWGPGYAKATVGSSVLLELAKAFNAMVETGGFRPRRSIMFASWSGGEYGSIGATEWLEGYMSSLDKKAFTYISLDGMVMGRGSLIASASPLLHSLMEDTMKEVEASKFIASGMLYEVMGGARWEEKVMRPMAVDDPAYPFMAFSGIPSVSFHFITNDAEYYAYYGTLLDNKDHLNYQTNQHTSEIAAMAARFAGQMALRLVHDHLLSLDVSRYVGVLTRDVSRVYKRVRTLSQSGTLNGVSPDWLSRAQGSFQRAAESIRSAVQNTDVTDPEGCRILNDRIMTVEHCLLSPYLSPVETPFRHLVFGRGNHTLASMAASTDMEALRTRLALATWNLQSCSNAMMGNIWELDNQI